MCDSMHEGFALYIPTILNVAHAISDMNNIYINLMTFEEYLPDIKSAQTDKTNA